MPEFLKLLPPNDALNKLLDHLPVRTSSEDVLTRDALGRVTTESITAPHPLPEFKRSTVDGFAVCAEDTHGASDGLPVYLHLIGEIPMGAAPVMTLQANQCAVIHTGGMLPEGADAVVMIENTQQAQEDEVEIFKSVAVDENVIEVGEDISAGEQVIAPGTHLRPAEIGGLLALGITRLSVARRPKVGIISSGDEVIPPGESTEPGQIRDINAYTLAALVEQASGLPEGYGIIPDQREAMLTVSSRALNACDMVVITAGSSASERDLTGAVVNQLGKPGVLVHGVNVRPGKPTILGVCDGKAVIGLPGNPVSALVIAGLFVQPVISALLGKSRSRHNPSITARLSINLASQTGREDWVPVSLSMQPDGYLAEPVFGKSNLIFILTRADGLVRIPPEATGLGAGELVKVRLF